MSTKTSIVISHIETFFLDESDNSIFAEWFEKIGGVDTYFCDSIDIDVFKAYLKDNNPDFLNLFIRTDHTEIEGEYKPYAVVMWRELFDDFNPLPSKDKTIKAFLTQYIIKKYNL